MNADRWKTATATSSCHTMGAGSPDLCWGARTQGGQDSEAVLQTVLSLTPHLLPGGTQSAYTGAPQRAQWILSLMNSGTEIKK